jgi:NADH-quinone oxidoreductase subunit L
MSVPLVILALLSVIGGFIGSLALIGIAKWAPLEHFLNIDTVATPSLSIEWISTGLSVLLALIGIAGAWRLYSKGFTYQENRNPLYRLVLNKYYVDEILTVVLIRPILALARGLSHFLEGGALDGGSRGVAWLFRGTSGGLRRLQTGYMRNYALAILLGAVLIIAYYVVYYAVKG